MAKNDIKLLFMDVDGTLTDGKIYMSDDCELFKTFDIKDGCGIHDLLPLHSIIPVIITARTSKILENRCKELNIQHLYQGCRAKKNKMIEVAKEFSLVDNNNGVIKGTAYIGDDILDIQCMEISELKGCPNDAVNEVKCIADFISSKNGGDGAVREFIEWIIEKY